MKLFLSFFIKLITLDSYADPNHLLYGSRFCIRIRILDPEILHMDPDPNPDPRSGSKEKTYNFNFFTNSGFKKVVKNITYLKVGCFIHGMRLAKVTRGRLRSQKGC